MFFQSLLKLNRMMRWLPVAVIMVLLFSCSAKKGRFVQLSSSATGIDFVNQITENDSVNIFDFANIYNGGGVGVGDFNNDGKQDLYFTGNMVSNRLYLNKGNLQFRDVTTISQTGGGGIWSRGVAVVDINNDGKQDLYVCATAKHDAQQRINKLYVNQGLGNDSIPVFKDMAAEYGLADTTQSTMAYFFDYDNDGDLDCYIGVNHIIQDEYANTFRPRNLHGEHPSTGRLYRNDWNDTLQHAVFKDVSREAGILIEGYTHAADIFDANNDGWQDILVLNDYISSNVLYINNHDGTFTDRVREYFKHAAANSMGSDAVDINNDGLTDVIEVDMAPQDNLRKKMFQAPVSYQMYQNTEQYGYQYQYTRNMLHVNLGNTVGEQDSVQHPIFAEAGYFAGIAETDWSWTPLVADFDNDGQKDILFTNGFPKDITDRDFMTYRNEAYQLTSEKDMLDEIPEVKIHNYIYRNKGDLKFEDMSSVWGMETPTFSNGAVSADLDNDGDLDIVINNINEVPSVYENRLNGKQPADNFINIQFYGTEKNKQGIGATVSIFQQGMVQTYTNNPFRGYISSQSPVLHAGLAVGIPVDSVVVRWPGSELSQTVKTVAAGANLLLDIKNAVARPVATPSATNAWFTNITTQQGISYIHRQRDFVDFNIQKLLPHKLSEYTPGIAAGDINGDGLDDFITGGVSGYSPMKFIQQPDGHFLTQPLLTDEMAALKQSEDRGLLLFDADNDNDNDLYIAAGGYQYDSGTKAYTDMLWLNDGKGNFIPDSSALPANFTSKFCVRAADYDKDGDLDLFIAGRVDPHAYPRPVSDFIYRNDSKNGKLAFSDVTKDVAPALLNAGLTCDGIFSDYDNDGWPDLVITGEWMPVTFLHNDKGHFVPANEHTSIAGKSGWWNSLAAGDFDNDGDMDYIAGNQGLNSFFRASAERPVHVYAKDFDDNKSYDAMLSLYLLNNLQPGGTWKEFPANGRDDMIKQLLMMRRDFKNYQAYALATMEQVLPADRREGALILSADYLASAYIQNDGNGHFTMKPLPDMAQLSLINGMVVKDCNGDGNLDIVCNTNDYGTDPFIGRYDALNGLVLQGDGKGNFTPLSILQSGIFINGNGKGLAVLAGADSTCLLAATQNQGPLQVYRQRKRNNLLRLERDDMYALITLSDGRKQRCEFYYGASFLSQSSRVYWMNNDMKSVQIINSRGQARTIVP